MDPKKLDRVTRGVEKVVKQQQAAVVKQRLEGNERESKQYIVAHVWIFCRTDTGSPPSLTLLSLRTRPLSCRGLGVADRSGEHRENPNCGTERCIMHNLYLSRAALACFEGEGADAGAGVTPGATPGEARFTQEDLNRYLAEDKRKHQAQLQRVEKMLEDVSASKNLRRSRARAGGPGVGEAAE